MNAGGEPIAPAAAAVSVRDLYMTFPGKRPGESVHVLERVNLDVRPGEFVCIVGPSGCGKSTLLNVIAGFLRQTRGEVLVEGRPVAGPDRRRIFVFQENGVFPWLTVRDNIGFGLSRKPPAERAAIVARYVEMVGLTGFEEAYPRELSGGMRQRVEIARALAADPDIIYMDEPFGALDFLTRLKMRSDLIRIWQAERKTVLFVTHDIEEAVQLADRVLVMSRRPATVSEVVEVRLPRPRDLDAPEYLRTRDRIFAAMGMGHQVGGEATERRGDGATKGHAVRVKARPEVADLPARDGLDADVIVVGGGPAGSIVASYLARAGVDHLLLDKAVHPRPHVGESLVCSTTRVFSEIGFLPTIEREGFLRKPGAVWSHFADPSSPRVLRFRPMPHLGIAQDWTYHVDRARFDALLLNHAESLGARVVEGAHVEQVEFTDGVATGVRVRQAGVERRLRCRVVVDASGRATLLGNQLRLKRNDPLFDQFAVHAWFEGVDRGPAETADFIHLHVLPLPRAWVWQIPITRTATSVGLVTRREHFVKGGHDVAGFFRRHIEAHPDLARRMASARPLHDFTREANYSYLMDRFAGDGWLMVGDAARFVDPIFSSGISVAAESARFAADAVVAALRAGDTSARAFARYERTVRGGVDLWREFILLYYRLPAQFLDLLANDDVRPQLLDVLQGEVYERASAPILDTLRRGIDAVERDPRHPWRDQLAPMS